MTGEGPAPRRGRARDSDIDTRILAAASRHLARHGYEALSVAAVADEAGTTRQALYRRWPTKASLAMSALSLITDAPVDPPLEASPVTPGGSAVDTRTPATRDPSVDSSGDVSVGVLADHEQSRPAPERRSARSKDALGDLVTELASFQRGVSAPGRLSLVGAMLQDSTDPDVRHRYRVQVVMPRRSRLRTILERAQADELIDGDADLDVAVTLCTGSWYARALASDEPPENWPERTARLVWRSVGGACE